MEFEIRRAIPADVDGITDVYNAAILETTATFDTQLKSIEDRTHWLESHDADHPVIVAVKTESVIGWASLSAWSPRPAYAKTVETSVYVNKKHQGDGCGTALYRAILDEARALGMRTAIAQITDENKASIRFHEKFGFTDVGVLRAVGNKFGRILDVRIMQLMFNQ